MVKFQTSWILLVSGISASVSAIAQYASTIRAPAYPLAVRQPYVSTWLAADNLPGNWPSFWYIMLPYDDQCESETNDLYSVQ
jgi:hypothetical protein